MKQVLLCWFGGVVLGLLWLPALAQCTKDIECRGDRICEKGVCVSPPTKPSTTPRVSTQSKPGTGIPSFSDYRVEYVDRSFNFRCYAISFVAIGTREHLKRSIAPHNYNTTSRVTARVSPKDAT